MIDDNLRTANALVGAPAREIRTEAERLLRDLHALLSAPVTLRQQAKSGVGRVLHEQAMARLSTVPATSLTRSLPSGNCDWHPSEQSVQHNRFCLREWKIQDRPDPWNWSGLRPCDLHCSRRRCAYGQGIRNGSL